MLSLALLGTCLLLVLLLIFAEEVVAMTVLTVCDVGSVITFVNCRMILTGVCAIRCLVTDAYILWKFIQFLRLLSVPH